MTQQTTHQPLTDQQLHDIEARANAATPGPWAADSSIPYGHRVGSSDDADWVAWTGEHGEDGSQADAAYIAAMHPEAAKALVAEVHRLRNELAEEKATHDPRLRCLIVKAAPDQDLYVGWSNTCDMPAGVWSRETALEYGFPPSRLDRADDTGSSSRIGDGAWDDKGWVAEQRGWLRRDLIGDYAVEYLHGDRVAAYALLEPFDTEAPA